MVGQQKEIGKEDVKETVSEDFFIALIQKKKGGGECRRVHVTAQNLSSQKQMEMLFFFFFSFTVFPPLLPEVAFHKGSY